MTNQEKLSLLKNRRTMLLGRKQNIKSGGVLRKINREIRKLEM